MMRKKHNTMFGYLTLILVIVVYMSMSSGREYKPESTFNDIMAMSDEYPQDPYTLMNMHNKISLCLYGGAILDEEIEPVLVKQRVLFSDEILELNPLETHLEKAREQIAQYRELKLYVHTIDIKSIEYDNVDNGICYVTVWQHTNKLSKISTVYYLALRDDMWRIIGWEATQEEVEQ